MTTGGANDEGSASGSSANGEDSSSDPSTTSGTSSDPLPADDTSDPDDGGSEDSTGPGDDSGDDSTGEPQGPVPCSFTDDFEDGEVESVWSIPEPEHISEANGHLNINVSASLEDFGQVRLSPDLGLAQAAARILVGQVPTTLGVQLMLRTTANDGDQVMMFKINDNAAPEIQLLVQINDGSGLGTATELSVDYDPVQHAWLQMRHEGGMSYFEASSDGVQFETLVELATPFALDEAWIGVAGNNWEQLDGDASVSVDAFELDYLCPAPG